jgi:hypothetical protein
MRRFWLVTLLTPPSSPVGAGLAALAGSAESKGEKKNGRIRVKLPRAPGQNPQKRPEKMEKIHKNL